MNTLGMLGFILGVFGLMAYLNISPLKRKIEKLESALSAMEGTTYHEDRESLLKAAAGYIGKSVEIDLKEDHKDTDIEYYGNSKYGSNTILDADRDWILVHTETPKGSKDKLIRLESIQRITEKK